jgi:hypothetical protein
MTAKGPHGHPTGYQRGCEQCKADRRAQRQAATKAKHATPEYKAYRAAQRRDERARQFKVVAFPSTAQPGTGTPEIGPNEQAVIDQCARLPKAEANPATVMHARTLAKLLDNRQVSALWPQAVRQIHVLELSLGAPRVKGRNRLAAVIAMTERNRGRAAQ